MYVIIKSGPQNWEGKAFTDKLPAKIYHSFDDAVTALQGYWYVEGVRYDHRRITFIPLTEKKAIKLILEEKARW